MDMENVRFISNNFHLLNIISVHSKVHVTKTFGLQPAMMLMNHCKRQIFPPQEPL